MHVARPITEADILTEIVAPDRSDLSPEAARTILGWRLPPNAVKEVRRLLRKNNRGTISAAERMDLDKYLRVGQFLDLLHAKSRLSLRPAR